MNDSRKSRFYPLLSFLIPLMMISCVTTKHVGSGQYLLDKVTITSDNKDIKPGELKAYLRQEPNHRTFGLFRFPLFLHNISGKDSTKWYNRWLRKMGTPPVIYDAALVEKSKNEIEKALSNRGYIHSEITVDTVASKKKIKVKYNISADNPYYLSQVNYNIPNDTIYRLIMADTSALLLKPGKIFDRSVLDEERQRITNLLRNNGYYAFNKDFITYTADTSSRDKEVELELNLNPEPGVPQETGETFRGQEPYYVRNIYFVTDYNPMNLEEDKRIEIKDTVRYKGYYILYGNKKYIRKDALINCCFIHPNQLYTTRSVDNTYNAFGRLRILKYVNIRFVPALGQENKQMLDCFIMLTEGKSQSLSADLEGTNSAGDFGFALGTTYQHRNIFHGSEVFTTKLRVAYESLSGNLTGIINNNYMELGGEIGISYPQFLFPLLKASFRRRLRAATEFSVNLSYQQRPEYTRVIAGAGWNYKWYTHRNMFRHHFDLIDISYIYLPNTATGFKNYLDSIAADNPLLRNSYENHFIMRMSYVFYRTNLNPISSRTRENIYTLRAAGEIAGNVLYAFSKMLSQNPGKYDEYTFLGIRYAQYAKADMDFAYTFVFDKRNSLALHAGAGIAVPYGNSEMLPFEKRYFSGGANSVRGWSVRSLGPGSYKGTNLSTDFMNQCGDIRLDLNAEYRTRLIWKLELAAFIDAGNIWTIKKYSSQPGGEFNINTFYKEIAMAYGLGLRLDFNYFILRFDLGMKAYDPGMPDSRRWVIAHPQFKRDATFHFAVGYPF